MAKKSKPVKKTVKKTVVKKAAAKKAVAKKPVAAKAKKAVKKAAVKKPVAKKVAVKKAAPKKAVAKKAPVKKPAPKRVTKKTIVAKKPATKSVKAIKKENAKPVSAASTPAMVELSEELVEKAANTGKPMMHEDAVQVGMAVAADPLTAFDKKVFNKATAKGDPHSRLHLSSKPKNAIKPSGKKPLW